MRYKEFTRKEVATESTGDGSGMMAAQAQLYKAGTPKKRRARSKVEDLMSGKSGTGGTGSLGPR